MARINLGDVPGSSFYSKVYSKEGPRNSYDGMMASAAEMQWKKAESIEDGLVAIGYGLAARVGMAFRAVDLAQKVVINVQSARLDLRLGVPLALVDGGKHLLHGCKGLRKSLLDIIDIGVSALGLISPVTSQRMSRSIQDFKYKKLIFSQCDSSVIALIDSAKSDFDKVGPSLLGVAFLVSGLAKEFFGRVLSAKNTVSRAFHSASELAIGGAKVAVGLAISPIDDGKLMVSGTKRLAGGFFGMVSTIASAFGVFAPKTMEQAYKDIQRSALSKGLYESHLRMDLPVKNMQLRRLELVSDRSKRLKLNPFGELRSDSKRSLNSSGVDPMARGLS